MLLYYYLKKNQNQEVSQPGKLERKAECAATFAIVSHFSEVFIVVKVILFPNSPTPMSYLKTPEEFFFFWQVKHHSN